MYQTTDINSLSRSLDSADTHIYQLFGTHIWRLQYNKGVLLHVKGGGVVVFIICSILYIMYNMYVYAFSLSTKIHFSAMIYFLLYHLYPIFAMLLYYSHCYEEEVWTLSKYEL